jgi:hypothetical protein
MKAVRQPRHNQPAAQSRAVSPDTNHQPCVPSHEMVAKRAFEIWQRHGCPQGTEFHDWLAAEAELRSHR